MSAKQGRWVHRAVRVVFVLVAVFMIAWAVAVGLAAYKAARLAQNADWSDGLRGVMEKVWCGRKGCMGQFTQ